MPGSWPGGAAAVRRCRCRVGRRGGRGVGRVAGRSRLRTGRRRRAFRCRRRRAPMLPTARPAGPSPPGRPSAVSGGGWCREPSPTRGVLCRVMVAPELWPAGVAYLRTSAPCRAPPRRCECFWPQPASFSRWGAGAGTGVVRAGDRRSDWVRGRKLAGSQSQVVTQGVAERDGHLVGGVVRVGELGVGVEEGASPVPRLGDLVGDDADDGEELAGGAVGAGGPATEERSGGRRRGTRPGRPAPATPDIRIHADPRRINGADAKKT